MTASLWWTSLCTSSSTFGKEKSLDFRVDFFNAFNHTIFHAPFGNIANVAAGSVFRAGTARQIQFGFRFSF